MKVLIPHYLFSATSGTISALNYEEIKPEQLLLITNVSKNKIIYNFADSNAGAFVDSINNVIYLSADTSLMDDSDKLQIFIEDYFVPSSEASLTAVKVTLDFSNTLLTELTAKQTTVNLDVSAINLNTNELEELVRTVNRSVTGVDVDITTFNRQLTGQVLTINQNVSATNPRLSSIDVKLTTLINQTDNIEGSLNSIANNTSYLPFDLGTVRTVQLSSGLNCGAFYIWSIQGTSFANYDQYLQVRAEDFSLIFTQKIKANENFKFVFWPNGPGQLAGAETISIHNSLTPFAHSPGNNDLYLFVRGQEF